MLSEPINVFIFSAPTFFDGVGSWLPASIEPYVTDGKFRIRFTDGSYLSLNYLGGYDRIDQSHATGPYEIFELDSHTSVIRITPRLVTYTIAIRERQ